MPRKRKTRAVAGRPKPKMPDGDEGNDLEQEAREEKLRVFLEDFDNESAAKIGELRRLTESLQQQINNVYSMEFFKIPKKVRDMKVTDFLRAGGDINTAAMLDVEQMVADLATSVDERMMALTGSGSGRSRTAKALNTISEEDDANTGTVQQTKGKSRKRAAFGKNTSNFQPPPSTARPKRNTRAGMSTPSNKGGPSAAGWETPLITPKFDPRLPHTPGFTRNARPGERLVSLAGSPVANKNIKVQEPEAMVFTRDGAINVNIDTNPEDIASNLDDSTYEKLRKLQETISSVLKYKQAGNN